ncbi:hypothetical protein [Clostridium sp. UBA1056]|uniref:hypothetical protein n=1 Tax=Clostridium sp. UBA1056 TaxID=1946346 RepID=UPI003216C8A7
MWWVFEEDKFSAYCALGDGGNVICCVPDKNLVVAIASKFMPRAKDRIELIKKYILPQLDI